MTRITLLLAALASIAGAAEPTAVRTASFDADPRWDASHNRLVPDPPPVTRQSFGYRPTRHAGGKVGEIGGWVSRSATPASYARAIPKKTLDDKLTASGTFAVTAARGNSGILFGWFNEKSRGWRTPDSLAFRLDGNGDKYWVFFEYGTHHRQTGGGATFEGERYQTTKTKPFPADGTVHRWSMSYDPDGAGGRGEITFVLDGQAHTRALAAGHKADGATFDRFGLFNHQTTGEGMEAYFDGLVVDGRGEDFAADPRWEGRGNAVEFPDRVRRPFHDFGFSATSHAGGAQAGEIGGVVWRGGEAAFYADRVGPFTLDHPLHASGKIALTAAAADSGVCVGFFDSRAQKETGRQPETAHTPDVMAVMIEGPSRVGHYFRPVCIDGAREGVIAEKGPLILPDGAVHAWSLDYDPAGGAERAGQIKVRFDDHVQTLDLKPRHRKAGATFDRFGLFNMHRGGHFVEVWLDDLKYGAAATAPAGPNPRVLQDHAGSVLALAFAPDGKTLASGSRDHTIKLWDPRDGTLKKTLGGHALDVYGVEYSPRGDLIASCSGDRTIKLWDAKTLDVVRTLEGHTDIVRAVAFAPDQQTLASVGVDRTVRLWDVRSGELRKSLTGHTARVKSVVWTPDGKTVATAASDRTIRLWDAQTGKQTAVLEGHTGDIETLAVSPDGKRLASSSGDTTVRIWDAHTGKLLRTLQGHTQEVDSVGFSPDGQTLVSGCKDKTIRLWDPQTGKLRQTLTGHTGRVESLTFSPDGKTLVTGGGGGDTSIRIWNLPRTE